jgi:hypothetical protein
MGHHQARLIIWGDHCTVHSVLSTLRYIVVVVVVVVVVAAAAAVVIVNLLRRIISSYPFSGHFTVMYFIYIY